MRETEVSSIFVGPLAKDGSIGGIVDKMLRTTAQRRQDQPIEETMNGALYLVGWDAMRKHSKICADPAASYGIMMDRQHSIEVETAADLAYASYAVEHGMSMPRHGGKHHDHGRRRIAVVTGSRADYGLLEGVLGRLRRRTTSTCRHRLRHASLPKFGKTWRPSRPTAFRCGQDRS